MAVFKIPEYVFLGKNALFEGADIIEKYGNKAFIVTGKHVAKSPMMDQLKKMLHDKGIAYCVYDGITGEPTNLMIEEGKKAYLDNSCEFLIAIGGGSPLDSMKAIAAMIVNPGKIEDYMGKEIGGDLPKMVAIPTTAGTGSEATKFSVITDSKKGIKMLLRGDKLIPDMAILNYLYTEDMPKQVTVSTGLDALTHAVEAYTSVKASGITDIYALAAVKKIMKYLPLALNNGYDEKAREEMQLASFLAGVCINNSSVTLVHGMSRPIGALFHAPHGLSNAMLLDTCLTFALDGAYDRFADLAVAAEIEGLDSCNNEKDKAEIFIKALRELLKICQVPSLSEYGIDKESFMENLDKMSEDAIASGSPANTRKPVSKEDCIRLYKDAFCALAQ